MNYKFDFIKRAISVSLAVLIAVLSSYYLKLPEKYWVPVTTLFVMQTAIGVVIRHSARRYLIIVSGVVLGTLIALGMKSILVTAPLAIIIFSVCGYFSRRESLNYYILSGPFLFGIIVVLALLLPDSPMLYERLYAVTLGAIIAVLANLMLLPVRPDAEFRNNMIAVLRAYGEYLSAIIKLLYKQPDAVALVAAQRVAVENALLLDSTYFPTWVYETGVSIALRQGHRHFLTMVERIGQTLFSMHHEARYEYDPLLLESLAEPLNQYVQQVEKIFAALMTVISLKKLSEGQGDLTEEITALEAGFKEAVPLSLEALDLSAEYIYLAAFIENAKDLQMALIHLGKALR